MSTCTDELRQWKNANWIAHLFDEVQNEENSVREALGKLDLQRRNAIVRFHRLRARQDAITMLTNAVISAAKQNLEGGIIQEAQKQSIQDAQRTLQALEHPGELNPPANARTLDQPLDTFAAKTRQARAQLRALTLQELKNTIRDKTDEELAGMLYKARGVHRRILLAEIGFRRIGITPDAPFYAPGVVVLTCREDGKPLAVATVVSHENGRVKLKLADERLFCLPECRVKPVPIMHPQKVLNPATVVAPKTLEHTLPLQPQKPPTAVEESLGPLVQIVKVHRWGKNL